jgi:hypothetical protein
MLITDQLTFSACAAYSQVKSKRKRRDGDDDDDDDDDDDACVLTLLS